MSSEKHETVEISSMAFGGEGVCRINGCVCFVEGAFTGEKALIEITDRKKNFLRGKALEIISPIPERIQSVCPLAYSCSNNKFWCPGCSYQSISCEKEIEFKNNQFSELLKKLAGLDPSLKCPPLYASENLFYRNKIKLHRSSSGAFGFISNDNKSVIGLQKCYIACHEINKYISKIASNATNSETITLRCTQKDAVRIVSSPNKLLTENTAYGEFMVPETSFFQVNIYAHKLLLEYYLKLLDEISPDILFDLYCGIGIFGILAAKTGIKSFGLDTDKEAIKTAEINSEKHGVSHLINFVFGDVQKISKPIFDKNKNYKTCAVLDPPRTGLDKRFLQILCGSKISDIIYISCSPDTLCRDLKSLNIMYRVASTRIIDMFPRTKHFETITHLKKRP